MPTLLRRFPALLISSLAVAPGIFAQAESVDLSKGRPPAVLDARVGTNIRLGADPSALPTNQRGQAEPHIARSASDPELLIAAFQDGRYPDAGAVSCGYAVSRDGGLTWRRDLIPNLTTVSGGRFNRATDPVAATGPQGELYLQSLASVTGVFGLAAVVVSRSTDGGGTWTNPLTVFESSSPQMSPDKNWLAVNDYAGAPNAGRLFSTWTNFIRNAAGATLSSPIVGAVSDDRGATWSAPIDITPTGSSNQASQPVFLPDGSLLVVYSAFPNPNNASVFNLQCKRSTDGGRTFPGAATTVVSLVNGWDDPDLRDGVFLSAIAVARQSGDVFVSYAALRAGSPRIFVTKSSDQGATWSEPVVVSDQPSGVSVMNPAIAAMPDGATVAVFFMDKRNAADGRNFVDHYAAMSFDGGTTWQPNVRLTGMSSDIRYGVATARGIMLGDYLGLASPVRNDQPFVGIWCDTRSGEADPWVVRFAPAPSPTFAAWQVARFNLAELGTTSLTDALGDFDADGYPNAAEFLLQSNPRHIENGGLFATHFNGASFTAAYRFRGTTQYALGWERSRDGLGWQSFAVPSPPVLGTSENEGILQELPVNGTWYYRPVLLELASGRGTPFGEVIVSFSDGRLINLATRGRSGEGTNQMIVGFNIDGNKSMLIRAAGPALAATGSFEVLADPQLTIFAPASDLQRTNDNWQEESGATPALFARVGAFPFAANSRDAALALELGPQNYTAVVSSPTPGRGIAVVEIYDADQNPGASQNPRLLNLSARGEAGAGENALIAGFVITGRQPRRVLIRAVGPGLEKLGISGALADPALTLYRTGIRITDNDDWGISRSATALARTAARVGAFPLNEGSLDAALLLTLEPDAYSVVINGAGGGTGIALIEVYFVD